MKKMLTAFAVSIALSPTQSLACACGCGIFDVGTSSMLPTRAGGVAWLEYDFENQSHNWRGNSGAPAADNPDKDIRTQFTNAGVEYMFSRDWGVQAQVPFVERRFTTTDDDTGAIFSTRDSSVGDIRVKGVYSGFSADMSSGITFGLKLPTGDYNHTGFDRDTSIGSGSTDLLLGGYKMGNLSKSWNWFTNAELDQPFLTIAGYRPGSEVNAVAGAYYTAWNIGSVHLTPVAQIIGSYRLHDTGIEADRDDSGYQRVLLSPGLTADFAGTRFYTDVAVPVYQHVKGDQLTAGALFKINISRAF